MKKFCYLVFVMIIGLGTTALTSCGIKLNGPEDVLNVQTKKTVVPEKVSPIPGIGYGDIKSYQLQKRDDTVKISAEIYDTSRLIANIDLGKDPKFWHEFYLTYVLDNKGNPKLVEYSYELQYH